MKSKIFIKHHISYKPPVIKLIPLQEHQKIHGTVPIVSNLNLKMRQYDKLVKISVMLKNWHKAYEKEFGENPVVLQNLSQIEEEKKTILKEVRTLIKTDLKKVKHIKGLGPRLLAGILAYAHPDRFPSVRKFLTYCGYKGGIKRYNRKVASIVNRIVIQLIIHKDEKYYPSYIKVKEDLKEKYPDYRKAKIDGMAQNRIGTFLLKEVYLLSKSGKG